MRNRIIGRVIEIGNIDALDGHCGLIIETTREEIMALKESLLYRRVEVSAAEAQIEAAEGEGK